MKNKRVDAGRALSVNAAHLARSLEHIRSAGKIMIPLLAARPPIGHTVEVDMLTHLTTQAQCFLCDIGIPSTVKLTAAVHMKRTQ
jgi:hypothetical protein